MQTKQLAFDVKRFGSYLRRLREERQLSLAAVEEMSSGLPERVTKSHLSRIENGQARPSFARMFTLSRIYDISVSSFAEGFESCVEQRIGRSGLPSQLGDNPDQLERAIKVR